MLPTRDQWTFNEIQADEPDRAVRLELCGSADDFVESMRRHVYGSGERRAVRFGRELADDPRGGYRAVVQFHVGSALFDWFFNGRSGYRAHYWSAPQDGLEMNDRLVALVRDYVLSRHRVELGGCEIRRKFQETERMSLTAGFFAQSLAPTLSKVWWCVNRLGVDCSVEILPPGLMGPRLTVQRP